MVGGGPAGLTAAIALAGGGVPTALVSPLPSAADVRTTALMRGSVTALERLGVWEYCSDHAALLAGIRLVDDTGRLIRGPEVQFMAAEIGAEVFGYNIENRHLMAALGRRSGETSHLIRLAQTVRTIIPQEDGVSLILGDGTDLRASLVIGADGRGSACRAAAGIATRRFAYPQSALTLNFAHRREHDDVSTEFHTRQGPFTLVPLPGRRSSLVCVVAPHEAERLYGLDDAALSAEIERRSHAILGRVTVESGRAVFPLSTETAEAFAARRIALVGEAAHVFPPIGAQGLNLGLRDAATIAELAVVAHRQRQDIGNPDLLARYDRQRRADITTRTIAVDVLNRSLLSDFLPVQGARGLGMYLLERLTPLRRAVMREGVMPRLSDPRLMRGDAL